MTKSLPMIFTVSKGLALGLLLIGMFILNSNPAAAATKQDLYDALARFSATLETVTEVDGQVLGAEVIRVSTDQQLLDAILSVSGGETIELTPGRYGFIHIQETQYNRTYVGDLRGPGRPTPLTKAVTITSADKNNPAVLDGVKFLYAPYWHVDNVRIIPTDASHGAVELYGNNTALTNSFISFGDSSNWSMADWKNKTNSAISVRFANDVTIADNYIENVGFGISIVHGSDNVKVQRNVIDGFRGDGIRGLGTNGLYEHNFITNGIDVQDGNHDDFFQSYKYPSTGELPDGNTLRFNTFMYETKSDPLRTSAQGIGMFDGFYNDWQINNNLVVANHWHGISLYGPVDSVVENNVVLDPNNERPGPSWIRMTKKKDGSEGSNTIVRNNYANRIIMDAGGGGIASNNTEVAYDDYDQYFVDYKHGDFSLKAGAVPFPVGADSSKLPDRPRHPYAEVVANDPVEEPEETPAEAEPAEEEPEVVTNSPVASFTVSDTTPETGQSVSFDASNSKYADSWVWDDAVGTVGQWPLGEGKAIDFTFKNPGTKQVRLTVSNEHGSDTKVIPVTVRAATEEVIEEPVEETEETPVEEEPVVVDEDAETTLVSVSTTDNLTVRRSPAGQRLGFQYRGAEGEANFADSVTLSGHKWVYVDFARGVDGYVASDYLLKQSDSAETTSNINDFNREQLLALIKQLIALIMANR